MLFWVLSQQHDTLSNPNCMHPFSSTGNLIRDMTQCRHQGCVQYKMSRGSFLKILKSASVCKFLCESTGAGYVSLELIFIYMGSFVWRCCNLHFHHCSMYRHPIQVSPLYNYTTPQLGDFFTTECRQFASLDCILRHGTIRDITAQYSTFNYAAKTLIQKHLPSNT